ncbi:MAG: hypothetical protein L3J36_12230 [Rhodobacteraceae bacterium]|nr:hypothetical protein [Paracoccaceae bacterium]
MSDEKPDPRFEMKKTWLTEIGAKVAASEANMELLDARRAGQATIMSLAADKDDIRDTLMSIEVTVESKFLGRDKKMKLLEGDGDYMQEVDTWHHGPQMIDAMTNEQSIKVNAVMMKVYALEEQLKQNPYYSPGDPPNFTDPVLADLSGMTLEKREEAEEKFRADVATLEKEQAEWAAKVAEYDRRIAEDLYHPLVREGVIPENLVPQKHSAVADLFDKAASAYDERLEEYSAELSDNDILLQKFELGFKLGQGVLKLAGSATGLTGAIGEAAGDAQTVADAEVVAEVLEHLTTALAISEGFTKAMLTDKDFTAVGQAIADAVTKEVVKGLDPMAAKIVSSVVANGSKLADIGKSLTESPPDYEAAFQSIVKGIQEELKRFDPDEDGGLMTLIGDALLQNATAAIQGKDIGKMIADGASPLAILSACMDAADTVGGQCLELASEPVMEKFNKAVGIEDEDDEDEDEDEDEDGDGDQLSSDITKGKKAKEGKITIADIEARRMEADKAAAETLARSAEQAAEAEREEFEKHLAMGFPVATNDQEAADMAEFERVQSIEYLITMQKKNEATFKMCEQIAAKGIALVTKIFPPAGLAEACMTLILTIKDAIEKTQEMMVWRENVEDAMTAVSPQADAMLNRSGLQTKQAMQANVQVAFDAAKVVSEVLKMTPAAGAAPIVAASVDVAEAAIELADLIYTEVQLARAWKIYEEARANPQDRWLARKATRENPTLSKYAMAYGALNGDPIAREGMRRCGLNKQTLANPDTNVSKVVTYLEAKYPDDPTLLRAVPRKDKWHPGPIEMTSTSFMRFYCAATTDAAVDSSGDVSGIAGALAKLESAETAFEAALKEVVERAATVTRTEHKVTPVTLSGTAKDSLSLSLITTRNQLDHYKPIDTETQSEHAEMAKYIDALRAKSEQRSAQIAKIIRDAPWTSKLKPDPEPV